MIKMSDWKIKKPLGQIKIWGSENAKNEEKEKQRD